MTGTPVTLTGLFVPVVAVVEDISSGVAVVVGIVVVAVDPVVGGTVVVG